MILLSLLIPLIISIKLNCPVRLPHGIIRHSTCSLIYPNKIIESQPCPSLGGQFENSDRERSKKKRRRGVWLWHCSRGESVTNSRPIKKRKARNHVHGSRHSEKEEDEEEEDGKLKGERSRSAYMARWSLGFRRTNREQKLSLIHI